jgi:hypothetical protein
MAAAAATPRTAAAGVGVWARCARPEDDGRVMVLRVGLGGSREGESGFLSGGGGGSSAAKT